MHRLIVPFFLGAALVAQTPPKNYQRQELSPQQKVALLQSLRQLQAKLKAEPKIREAVPGGAASQGGPCAIPLLNALRPDVPIPYIRQVPVPKAVDPMPEVKTLPVCPERK